MLRKYCILIIPTETTTDTEITPWDKTSIFFSATKDNHHHWLRILHLWKRGLEYDDFRRARPQIHTHTHTHTLKRFRWVFLLNGMSTFMGLFNAKAILYFFINAFLKGISPKMKVVALLELELVYFVAVVQHFSLYVTGTHHTKCVPGRILDWFQCWGSSSSVLGSAGVTTFRHRETVCKGPTHGSSRYVWKLLALDRNTQNPTTVV